MNKNKVVIYSAKKNNINEFSISSIKVGFIAFVIISVIAASAAFTSQAFISEEKNYEIKKLKAKNNALTKELLVIDKKITGLNDILFKIQSVDDQLRLETNLPKVENDIRNMGIGGTEIDYFLDENLDDANKNNIAEKYTDLDDLERKLDYELNSFKKIFSMMKIKEDSLKYLPTILPIPADVYRVTSVYGKRIHPILGRLKNHPGIDMGCAEGTPIYASADGIIDYAGLYGGYGKYVRVGHRSHVKKYGYQTIYAHMSKIFVKKGQSVKRGDIIGEVGSTGLSTAPHLHYEVRYKRKTIKPDDYYFVNVY